MHKNIDEWYDPFIELKKKMQTKRGVVANNMPKDVQFISSLPPHVVKKQIEMRQKFKEPIKFDPYSFVLRKIC